MKIEIKEYDTDYHRRPQCDFCDRETYYEIKDGLWGIKMCREHERIAQLISKIIEVSKKD